MLRKVGGKKFSGIRISLVYIVLNEMWVKWVSGRGDPITIYGKNEPGLLFVDGLK